MSSPPFRLHTPVVGRSLIGVCVLVFLLQAQTSGTVLANAALWPLGPDFAPWQVLSYAFLHGGVGHLFFNMSSASLGHLDLHCCFFPASFVPRWHNLRSITSLPRPGLPLVHLAACSV